MLDQSHFKFWSKKVNGQRSTVGLGRVNGRVGSGQRELDFKSAESLTAPPPHAPPSTADKVDTGELGTAQGTRWCGRCRKRSNDQRTKCTLIIKAADSFRGKTNLSHDGLNPAHVPYWWVNNPTLGEFCFTTIGRADIEGSKSNVAMNAWLPQASYPCGNFSDTSSFKFRRSKGSIGHAFTVRIRTGNQNQTSFYPFVPHEISVLVELILGHLRYLLTDVPPQPNSPPDNVFRPDRPTEASLGSKKMGRAPLPIHGITDSFWMKNIWRDLVPPRVEIFMWQVMYQRVPVKQELHRRGVSAIVDVACPFCKKEAESSSHLFFTCFVAWSLWNKFLRFWGVCSVL
ncbi:Regulator of rDNA transcription protein 15 [Hibiscus syriacus]|uniref:Regulator of rDNA transcription protein 15 n=1 Tax=Hibiscus syriacus TaxID=106335 RepID=A0A6A2Y6S0_HIBSY|nr:Regulator of rDNA transcription protein 15 [Hibiscus syriacus]